MWSAGLVTFQMSSKAHCCWVAGPGRNDQFFEHDCVLGARTWHLQGCSTLHTPSMQPQISVKGQTHAWETETFKDRKDPSHIPPILARKNESLTDIPFLSQDIWVLQETLPCQEEEQQISRVKESTQARGEDINLWILSPEFLTTSC